MPTRTARVVRVPTAACLIVFLAFCGALAAGRLAPGLLAAPQLQPAQSSTPVPPLVLDAIAIDKKGTAVADLKPSEFEILIDGKPRPDMAIARLFRGPGASGLAAAHSATMPGEILPLAEPSRAIVIAADQGSLLPGDERRTQLIAENLLGLVALGDRVMFVTLPDPKGALTLSVERDPMRQGLARLRAMRPIYALSTGAIPSDRAGITDAAGRADERLADVPDQVGVDARREDVPPDSLAKLDDLMPDGRLARSETISPSANRAHAMAMLDSLRRVLDELVKVPGSKTVLLLSAGLVADGAAAEMRAAQDAAAASFTRIYAIQVPTPAERFMEQGRIGLINLARHTGGGLVTLTDRPAQALQRMMAELSFSYLLLLPPQATDADKALHTVSVRTRRKDVTIRTSTTVARGRPLPADAAAPPSQPSGGWVNVGSPSGATPLRSGNLAPGVYAARPARPPDPALEAVLARVSDYTVNYRRELSAVVAEEVYEQRVTRGSSAVTAAAPRQPSSRRTVSDYLLVKVPGDEGWTPFRDVFEVDGVKVRDRDNRLQQLFLEAPWNRAAENANKIWQESARYNIGAVWRTINVPTLALMFAMPTYQPRFEFTKGGEPTEAGIHAWEIDYREILTPTIIQTPTGDNVAASGTFWVDPVSGRLLRTTLRVAGATITVTYRPWDDMAGLWLPVTMRETYAYPSAQIQATATYSNYRRFQVLTQETFTPPKRP